MRINRALLRGSLEKGSCFGRASGFGTQISLHNGGGIRASLEAGLVTVADITLMHPFGNGLSFFSCQGAGMYEDARTSTGLTAVVQYFMLGRNNQYLLSFVVISQRSGARGALLLCISESYLLRAQFFCLSCLAPSYHYGIVEAATLKGP